MSRKKKINRFRPVVDSLESRQLLTYYFSSTAFGLTPTNLRSAYNVNGSTDGSGQTIGIVVAGHDANIASDLHAFNVAYGLSDSSFTVYTPNTTDTGTAPTIVGDPTAPGYAFENCLDVEMAHLMAPGASIVLVETGTTINGIIAGMKWAAENTSANIISTSYTDSTSETQSFDNLINSSLYQPTGKNVVYVVAVGDSGTGSANTNKLAYSPNVLAVGGTNLTLNGSGGYGSETIWSSSGGYDSAYNSVPLWQHGVNPFTEFTHRNTADVAFDAGTAVSVYDTLDGGSSTPWGSTGGTSVGAPAWAGVVANINQCLVQFKGLSNLSIDSLHSDLYALKGTSAFHCLVSQQYQDQGLFYANQVGLGSPNVANLVNAVGDRQIKAVIAQAYDVYLGRSASNSDLAYWATQFDNGTSLATILGTFAHSAECYARETVYAYQTILDRTPGQSEIDYYVAARQNGETLIQVQNGMYESSEFFNNSGGTNSGFVTQLYQRVLGRTPSSSDVSYWSGIISGGTSRHDVAHTFLYCNEHLGIVVNADYYDILGRTGDSSGVNAWITYIQNGNANDDVIGLFLGCSENLGRIRLGLNSTFSDATLQSIAEALILGNPDV